MVLKAKVKLRGIKTGYPSDVTLADSRARMSLVDSSLAEYIGVEHTGRELNFISISGYTIKASEAVIAELEIEGEILKWAVIAVAKISESVKEALRRNELDENMIIGVLTLERANMIPDTSTGKLKKVESFIFPGFILLLLSPNSLPYSGGEI